MADEGKCLLLSELHGLLRKIILQSKLYEIVTLYFLMMGAE
jgi:hypothetical protein